MSDRRVSARSTVSSTAQRYTSTRKGLLKRQRQARPSIESAIIDPRQKCQGSKNSSEWSISIILHSVHLSSQLCLKMITLGNCLPRNVGSLILKCLNLKGVKQQIGCGLSLHFCLLSLQSSCSRLLYFLSGVRITNDWRCEILHMWGLPEVWQHFPA